MLQAVSGRQTNSIFAPILHTIVIGQMATGWNQETFTSRLLSLKTKTNKNTKHKLTYFVQQKQQCGASWPN